MFASDYNIQVCCLKSVSPEYPVQTLLDTKIPTGRNPCTFRNVHNTPLNSHPAQGRPGVAPASPAANGEVRSLFSPLRAPLRSPGGGRGQILVCHTGLQVLTWWEGRSQGVPEAFVFVCRSRHWRLAGLSEWGQGHKNRGTIILFSIVMDTLACHAGDCGSVPHGTICFFFNFFVFLMAAPGPLNLGGILQAQNCVLHSTHSAPVSNLQRKMHIQH